MNEELTSDELEVIKIYRVAKDSKESDIEISVKNGSLAKVYITNKKLYDREGHLKEIEK
jgi:hypothetical protein